MNENLLKGAGELIEKQESGSRITCRDCESFMSLVPAFTDEHNIEDTKDFLEYLGSPQDNLNIIHVAGTNGKGSVCSYLSQVLVKGGYTVGMFTSPHLVRINERFCVDGKPVSEGVFAEVFVETLRRVLEYDKNGYFPTAFELLFLVAVTLYDVYPVDFLILETGLGGRLDATNTVNNPILTLITEIGYDHMQYLGATIEEIAAEKAGIIKPGVPVIFFDKTKAGSDVLRARAKELGCEYTAVDTSYIKDLHSVKEDNGNRYIAFSYNSLYYRYADLKLATTALYQSENAAVAVTALLALRNMGYEIKDDVIREGLLTAKWPGRMEELRPGFFVDGAHNIDGIEAFLKSAAAIDCEGRKLLLFGIASDKQYMDIVTMILGSGIFDEIYVSVLESKRSLTVADLKSAFEDARERLGIFGLPIKYYSNVGDAMLDIVTMRKSKDYVFAAGSLYLAGQVKTVF